MLAAPAIIVLVLTADNGSSAAALVLFVAAALTDFLDGLVARTSGSVTELGRRLDPLADRILISGTIVALAVAGLLPVLGVFLVVARDFFLIIGYKLLQRRGIVLRVSLAGKSYTALFMVAIIVAIAGFEPSGVRLGWWLFWIGVAGSLATGAAYSVAGLRRLVKSRAAAKGD